MKLEITVNEEIARFFLFTVATFLAHQEKDKARLKPLSEAAEYMGMTRTTFLRLNIPPVKLSATSERMWDVRDLHKFIEQNKQ